MFCNERCYYTYINTNKRNTVLYTGVTNNLQKRNWQHKENINKNNFSYKYNINKLVYYETFANIDDAIFKEKQIKNLLRNKKITLIESINPNWEDLLDKMFE